MSIQELSKRTIVVAMAAVVTALCGSALAQSGAARISSYAWGHYSATSSMSIDVNGANVGSFSKIDQFIDTGLWTYSDSVSSVPAPAVTSVTSPGDLLTSPFTVALDARAGTSWGANHVYAGLSGFDPYATATVTTLCPTVPGSGSCIPGLPEQTQTLTTSNKAWAHAQSRWEEIYQTGGGTGALTTTFSIHVALGSAPSTSGTPSGSASFNWYEQDFGNNTVAQFYATYNADVDAWYAQSFSNVAGSGGWHYYSGTGALTIGGANGMTLSSADGATFDGTISGERSFATGDVVYVSSLAYAFVEGNGLVDAENTVIMTQLAVPTGIRLLAQSVADYGGVLGGGGQLCSTSACLSGGDGGGLPPVPEPGAYALLLIGLGMVGWVAKPRRQVET